MIFLLMIILFLIVFYFYLIQNYDYWKKRDIFYIKPTIFFGNFKSMFLKENNLGIVLSKFYNSSSEDMVGVWIMRTPVLLIRDPEKIKEILIQNHSKFADRLPGDNSDSKCMTAKGIFFANYTKWKQLRQKFSPIFTLNKIKNMVPITEKTCKNMLFYLEKNNESNIESKEFAMKFTMDITASSIFGIETNCFIDDKSPFRNASMEMIAPNISNLIRQSCYVLLPTLTKLLNCEIVNPDSISYLKAIFLQTTLYREKSGIKRGDVIDAMLELKQEQIKTGQEIDEDEYIVQALVFYLASFETTSSTISFTIYELAINEGIQNKLREEIIKTLEQNSELKYESIQEMKYLEMVVSETLRKYPPLPFLHRYCVENYKIGNLNVEKGTLIYIPTFALHHDEKYFPEPEVFNPERFKKEEIEARIEGVYLPFGMGPKYCIGARLGLLVVKMCLCHILMNYKLEICNDTPNKIEFHPAVVTLQPENGIPIRFIKINNHIS